MRRRLLLLFFTLFVAMVGFGVTLPALPFFVERLALGRAPLPESVALHVGALTSAYALSQLATAPLWGWSSDRYGRKPLLTAGLFGLALAQAVFGLSTSLPWLYGMRLLGGASSAAITIASAAYIADTLPEEDRGRGMAWQGTALSLGFVVGPVLSGLLTRRNWHIELTSGHFVLDGFSIPFLAAAALSAAAAPPVVARIPESRSEARGVARTTPGARWLDLGQRLRGVLALVFISQAALALFEAVFALYAGRVLRFGMTEIGYAFAICGLVMAVFQGGIVGLLRSGRARVRRQVAAGFFLLGAGLLALLLVRPAAAVFGSVALLALGMALITPNLLTLIANRSGPSTGAGIGLQSTFSSLGQVTGPVLGGLLFGWQAALPFQIAAGSALLLAVWVLTSGPGLLSAPAVAPDALA